MSMFILREWCTKMIPHAAKRRHRLIILEYAAELPRIGRGTRVFDFVTIITAVF